VELTLITLYEVKKSIFIECSIKIWSGWGIWLYSSAHCAQLGCSRDHDITQATQWFIRTIVESRLQTELYWLVYQESIVFCWKGREDRQC